ncbi:hypothetical protein HNY73_008419 [Argiope bruennichi]|uniref:Uncharacterized protein n=1 Tax=Argiope bruennichi TaxID=94029 RepID=A0A8T0FBK7_ARGBR|nr:hypothetical protein HNY73_008419 [Argiope bruennichi]
MNRDFKKPGSRKWRGLKLDMFHKVVEDYELKVDCDGFEIKELVKTNREIRNLLKEFPGLIKTAAKFKRSKVTSKEEERRRGRNMAVVCPKRDAPVISDGSSGLMDAPYTEQHLLQVNCPACGKLIPVHFSRGMLSLQATISKEKLLEEVGFDFTRLQETPKPETNMDTQDNWANRSTPTTQFSKSLAPTSTSISRLKIPFLLKTPNQMHNDFSFIPDTKKSPKNDFQMSAQKSSQKAPHEENFKITTENSTPIYKKKAIGHLNQ